MPMLSGVGSGSEWYDEAQMIRREIAEGLLKQKLHAEGIGAVGIDYPALRETVERMTMSVMNAKK